MNTYSNNNINNNNEKIIRDYGIYKIETFKENYHPEYNDNKYFSVLNFTFYFNKTYTIFLLKNMFIR